MRVVPSIELDILFRFQNDQTEALNHQMVHISWSNVSYVKQIIRIAFSVECVSDPISSAPTQKHL